ncbi:MAG: DUF4380 domain-containing protein [Caldilinea sp.]|nr:DUF4380 domain-containing protein [Caldilinea sp.]
MSDSRALVAEPVTFRGWSAWRLANEFVQLIAVPKIGGRVMAYDLGDHPFLFVDPGLAGKLFSAEENQGDGSLAAWKNYGGDKTWPAPQGWDNDEQWHGPPDPILDTGRYTVDEVVARPDRAAIAMSSLPDPRTGVQITRRFTLAPGSSRVQVELTFRNVSDRAVRWGIWDVVQLNAARTLSDGSRTHDPTCTVTAPVNPQSRFARGFTVMFGADDNPQWQVVDGLFRADYQWAIGKVGLDSPAGWIAFHQASQQAAFVEQFAYVPGAAYPDEGATVECWTVGAGKVANLDYADSGIYLMETEVLGPLTRIEPGATTTFAMEWGACRCTGAVVDVQPGGCAAQRLAASVTGDAVRLTGSFGVFDAGQLIVAWLDGADQELANAKVQRADPLTGLDVDTVLIPPSTATGVEIRVRSDTDGKVRRLAEARL